MDALTVVYSPDHLLHDAQEQVEFGRRWPMNECPQRAEVIRGALESMTCEWQAPIDHGVDPVTAVHDPDLVRYLETAWSEYIAALGPMEVAVADAVADTFRHPAMNQGMPPFREPPSALGRLGYWCFDTTTPIVQGTYRAARSAVDVAVTATDRVLAGTRVAYGLCRPPGHHAPVAGFGGYCYFNNAAIAAQRAVASGAHRVSILDVDYHHGNGTQQIFWERADVQYVSLHGDPARAYPYFCGFADELGTGAGRGTNTNVPLDAQCSDDQYQQALGQAIDAISAHRPDVLIVSLGVDTYGDDPLGDFALTTDSYARQGAAVRGLDLPTVVVQEGGYDVATIGINVASWLRGLAAA